ncbi:TPA: hypothetical protein ACX6NV_000547 [Photobacterium damselae]
MQESFIVRYLILVAMLVASAVIGYQIKGKEVESQVSYYRFKIAEKNILISELKNATQNTI